MIFDKMIKTLNEAKPFQKPILIGAWSIATYGGYRLVKDEINKWKKILT